MKPSLFLYTLLLFLLLAGIFSSCREFIEPSISDKQMQPEAPGNNYQSSNYNTQFWWDEVDDALTYRLQVVTARFDSVSKLVLDTVVKTNTFLINLDPGQYQWHVRAQNGSSQTAYSSPRSFTIFFSSITQQKVQLLAPAAGLLSNQSATLFQWGNLYGATKYRLQIDTNNFVNEAQLVYDQSTPALQLNFNLPRDQTYQWRVRAENDTAQAQWSVINSLTYDHTPPEKVSLSSPANNQTISLPVSLQWATVATATKYKLYVFKADSTTAYSSSFPLLQTGRSYTFNQGTTGDLVYWRVVAVDAAGNEGLPSELRHFSIQ